MIIEILLILSLGLVFGSFVTCASYRLPLELDVVRKPSYCPACDTKLTFKDLWPVFSWLAARGKCRHCSAKMSIRYPLIELATAGLFLMIYLQYGLSVQTLLLLLAAVALMIMIVADFEHYIIPDCVHVVLLPLALAYRFATDTFSPDILWGFFLMSGLALLLHYGYSALRGRSMLGYGDVKFFAVAGVWLDISAIPVFLFFSGLLGVLLGLVWRALGRGPLFPFGPALAAGLFLCVLYPENTNLLNIMGQLLE